MDHEWYVIPKLSEYTVCENCFDAIVRPRIKEKKAIPMMSMRERQRLPIATCRLHVKEMRDALKEAVESDRYSMLSRKLTV